MAEGEAEEKSLTGTPADGGADDMTFFEHLEELRSTLIACLVAFAAASTRFYRRPCRVSACLAMSGKFVAPALTDAERVRLIPFCAASSGLFLAGAAAAFFWLAPLSIGLPYLLAEHFGMQMHWLAEDYYLFVVMLTLFCGLMFEFPLLVVLLQYLELVSRKTLLEKWRWALTGILVAVVLVSPIGDPAALLVFSGALFALYLAAVHAGAFFLRRKKAREAAEEKADAS